MFYCLFDFARVPEVGLLAFRLAFLRSVRVQVHVCRWINLMAIRYV
jgi:hypothetical protein